MGFSIYDSGGQIIRLSPTENLPTATELPSTTYRLIKKSKIGITIFFWN